MAEDDLDLEEVKSEYGEDYDYSTKKGQPRGPPGASPVASAVSSAREDLYDFNLGSDEPPQFSVNLPLLELERLATPESVTPSGAASPQSIVATPEPERSSDDTLNDGSPESPQDFPKEDIEENLTPLSSPRSIPQRSDSLEDLNQTRTLPFAIPQLRQLLPVQGNSSNPKIFGKRPASQSQKPVPAIRSLKPQAVNSVTKGSSNIRTNAAAGGQDKWKLTTNPRGAHKPATQPLEVHKALAENSAWAVTASSTKRTSAPLGSATAERRPVTESKKKTPKPRSHSPPRSTTGISSNSRKTPLSRPALDRTVSLPPKESGSTHETKFTKQAQSAVTVEKSPSRRKHRISENTKQIPEILAVASRDIIRQQRPHESRPQSSVWMPAFGSNITSLNATDTIHGPSGSLGPADIRNRQKTVKLPSFPVRKSQRVITSSSLALATMNDGVLLQIQKKQMRQTLRQEKEPKTEPDMRKTFPVEVVQEESEALGVTLPRLRDHTFSDYKPRNNPTTYVTEADRTFQRKSSLTQKRRNRILEPSRQELSLYDEMLLDTSGLAEPLPNYLTRLSYDDIVREKTLRKRLNPTLRFPDKKQGPINTDAVDQRPVRQDSIFDSFAAVPEIPSIDYEIRRYSASPLRENSLAPTRTYEPTRNESFARSDAEMAMKKQLTLRIADVDDFSPENLKDVMANLFDDFSRTYVGKGLSADQVAKLLISAYDGLISAS